MDNISHSVSEKAYQMALTDWAGDSIGIGVNFAS